MFEVEKISKNVVNFNVYENIEVSFSKSLEFNPNLFSEINKVYKRTLNNQAKFILGCFHLNIFDSLEAIVRNTGESDDFVLDLSEFIANYFDDIDQELNIQSPPDFEEFIHILKLSSIIIEDACQENDMELIFEAFYQIKSRFEKENLINVMIHYNHKFNSDKYEYNELENVKEFSTTLKDGIEVNYVEL